MPIAQSCLISAGSEDYWTDEPTFASVKIEKSCSKTCLNEPNCLVYHSDLGNCFLCSTKHDSNSEEPLPVSKDWILIYHQLEGVWFGTDELSACQVGKFAALDQIQRFRFSN